MRQCLSQSILRGAGLTGAVGDGQVPDALGQSVVWIMVEVGAQLAIRYVVEQPPIPRDRLVDEIAGMFIAYLTTAVAVRSQ